MTRIAVVTVARSDYGIFRPVLRALRSKHNLEALVIAGGAHLAEHQGRTLDEIAADGFTVDEQIEMSPSADTPEAVAQSCGVAVMGFAAAYARQRPDVVFVLGDRFEMHAAAAAAVPFRIPIAHLHGGEVTEGAMDEQFRHAITKLSHLHFVATDDSRRRVVQMGEEPWRVIVTGAPGLDNLSTVDVAPIDEVRQRHGVDVRPPFLLVTLHPETGLADRTARLTESLLAALDRLNVDVLFTAPNADTGNETLRTRLEEFVIRKPRAWLIANLGTRDYFGAMKAADAMVGNSSSGIIEAPSFALPVVNIGDRQSGRLRAANVIDSGPSPDAIAGAIERARSPAFRASLAGLRNPYGDGHASSRIADCLADLPGTERLLRKRFHDL